MVKVSGVPYDVDLPSFTEAHEQDDLIATLEQENRFMRARMDRLEDELRVSNELIVKMNIENLNLHNDMQRLKESLVPNTTQGEH